MPRLVALHVGVPQTFDGDAPWTSGIYKRAAEGPIHLSHGNLAGDRQADLSVHGGPDKAVCAYPSNHYARWQAELPEPSCGPGWFGENFCVGDLEESHVSIGDLFRVGSAIVQVSQPRAPCWKLGRRWNRPDMPKVVVATGRTGWYFRVVEPGIVAAGDDLVLIDRPFAAWTIDAVNGAAYSKTPDPVVVRGLAECEALSEAWRSSFRERSP